MNKLFIGLIALMASTSLAQEGYQVEIQAEFVAFDKAALDQLANANPNQILDLQTLSQLRKEGKATVLFAPRILTPSGANAEVKSVEEIIYPTELAVETCTNLAGKTDVIVFPSAFETREVGVVFNITPVVGPDGYTIHMTFQAGIVAPPTWRNYAAKYFDFTGTERTGDLPQPFFHTRNTQTSMKIHDGQTVIAAGGMNDLDNKTTTFLFITARLVDADGNPIPTEKDEVALTDHDLLSGSAAVTAPAEQLTNTVVTAYLDCPIPKRSNLLWCATFQLAWDQLRSLVGEPIQLDPPLKECDILNKSPINTNDLDASSYIAVAGRGPQALASIKKELETRFAGAARPELLPSALRDQDLIAYAYLFQHLPFKCAFTRMNYPFAFAGAKVASFGMMDGSHEDERAKQVVVHDYRHQDDFIVELLPTNSRHRIILAHVPPAGTLSALIETLQSRINAAMPAQSAAISKLQIPIIGFDLLKTYTDFQRKLDVENPMFKETQLTDALQSIRFRLDEKGAVLKSEAVFLEGGERGLCLVFRKPFLVLLQKQGASTPYLALWVANAELLTRFRRQQADRLPEP